MMKNYQYLLVLIVGLLLLNACSQESNSHLTLIPADAIFVANVQAKDIFKKGDLENPDQYQFLKKIADQNNNPILSKYIENPKEAGLKTNNFYIFGQLKDENPEQDTMLLEDECLYSLKNNLIVSFSFRVSDVNKFEAFLGEIWKEKYNILPIEDKANYKIIKDNDFTVLWNKENCLMITNPQNDANYDNCFTLPESQSIVSVVDFQLFQKKTADIAVWGTYDKLLDCLMAMSRQNLPIAMLESMKDVYGHLYIDFKSDEIKVITRMSPENKVEEYLVKYPIIKKDFNQALLRDFPKTSYFTYKVSFNLEEYMKLIQEVLSENKEDDYSSGMLLETFESPTAKTVINALGGDAVLSIYDFARGGLPIPLAGVAFTVKSEDDFKSLISLLPEGMARQSGNYYTVPVGGMISVYFAYKENRVYITNDVEGIANFTGKGFDSKLSSHDLGTELKKSPYVFYVNLDIDSYPEDIRNFLLKLGEETVVELKIYKDLTIKITEKNEMELSLKFKNSSDNALKQLIKCVDNISGQYN